MLWLIIQIEHISKCPIILSAQYFAVEYSSQYRSVTNPKEWSPVRQELVIFYRPLSMIICKK